MENSRAQAAQAAPVAASPPAHVHTFSAHSRSLVALSGLDSYWCALHTVCETHVPGNVGVGGTFMNSLASHSLTAAHVK